MTMIASLAESMLQAFPVNAYPNLAAFITEHAMKPGYDHANEFEWGLDVILGGLVGIGLERDVPFPR